MKARAFIAAEFNRDILAAIRAAQRQLQSVPTDVRWVPDNQMHLTLKFLGDHFDLKDVPLTLDIMREATVGCPSVEAEVLGLDAFPNLHSPRVIVAHIIENSGKLAEIQRAMEDRLSEKLGYPPETRKFRPHLTLGRVRSGKNLDRLMGLVHSLEQLSLGKQMLTSLTLYMSELRPEGPEYTSLGVVDF
jgi:2'-5' RNA ligase